MPFDSKLQRQIMGHFPTGVSVVTTGRAPEFGGLTANALASLSLDPALVLVAVERKSSSHQVIVDSGAFAINFLAAGQEDLSRRFAHHGPKDFSDLEWTTAVTGVPILGGTLAYVDCRLQQVAPGGDHDIFIGEIVAGEVRGGQPLIYYCGKYTRLAE